MKAFYFTLGIFSLGLAVIGIIVPMMPAFPFIMLSAFCFSKSSKKMNDWFLQTKLYKNNFESFTARRMMTKAAKYRVIASVTLTMGFGFALMGKFPIGRIILGFVWLFHVIYFLCGIPTIDSPQEDVVISETTKHNSSNQQ